ncbi:peptidoglycan-binding domain-containing protein [Streptomyces sp. SRF1]|uniref:peptidoglycan-binding domain-containing protein n=1 Tax=Streptomyces sp. SRF1 TaxID=1549642 RepID=UPI0025B22C6B|nr:peptidoglycan-binding domain-containing protein [Streptomyces sp. SRF1]MDN3059019.1 peptidoglycan-binding domain-containing protein [Streptomyces sp. SRF1]
MAAQRRALLTLTALFLVDGVAATASSTAAPARTPAAVAKSVASCDYYSGTGPVQSGETYPDRRTAQVQCLIDTNTSYRPPLPIDGIYGPQTKRAVIVVQQHAGLTPDGIVGSATWAALRAGVWW